MKNIIVGDYSFDSYEEFIKLHLSNMTLSDSHILEINSQLEKIISQFFNNITSKSVYLNHLCNYNDKPRPLDSAQMKGLQKKLKNVSFTSENNLTLFAESPKKEEGEQKSENNKTLSKDTK